MKSPYKKVVAVLVIIALVSTIGYGVYRYTQATRSPNVTFTTINFKVNYQGNYSGYLAPTLFSVRNFTNISNSKFSSNYQIYKAPDGQWILYFLFSLGYNSSSTVYRFINSYGYHFNDSVVIDSITTTTPGFILYPSFENGYSGGGQSPGILNDSFPCVPDGIYTGYINANIHIESMNYQGPLNITITASSPARSLVLYHPHFSEVQDGNSTSQINMSGNITDGLRLPGNNYFAVSNDSNFTSTFGLTSQFNFTVVNISVTSPFLIPAQNYSNPVIRYHLGANYTTIPYYVDEVTINVTIPKGLILTNLNLTVYVKSA